MDLSADESLGEQKRTLFRAKRPRFGPEPPPVGPSFGPLLPPFGTKAYKRIQQGLKPKKKKASTKRKKSSMPKRKRYYGSYKKQVGRLRKAYSKCKRKVGGHGDYWSFDPFQIAKGKLPFSKVSDASKGLGAQIGGLFGKSSWGQGAHEMFKKITGFGDYTVTSNTLMMGNDPPSFAGGRGVIIQHREYIQDINGSVGFSLQSFKIQPGLPGSFPWLAQIAANFEKWCLRGCIYEFKSTSADALNSTNTALGMVIMATQYNSLAPNFTMKSQMENHQYCTATKPSLSMIHPIECSRGETPVSCLYTRSGSVPTNADGRLYDFGNFQIATIGMQAAAVIGELWVTYDVELLVPQLYEALGDSIECDHYQLVGSGLTASHYFGTAAPTLQSGSDLGSSINIATGSGYVTFPNLPYDNYYLYIWQVVGTATTLTVAMAATLGSGVTAFNLLGADTGSIINCPAGATGATTQFYIQFLKVAANTSTAAGLTFNAGTTPTLPTSGDVYITQINPLVATMMQRALEEKAAKESKEVEDELSEDEAEGLHTLFEMLKHFKKGSKKTKKIRVSSEGKEEKKDPPPSPKDGCTDGSVLDDFVPVGVAGPDGITRVSVPTASSTSSSFIPGSARLMSPPTVVEGSVLRRASAIAGSAFAVPSKK